MLLNRRSVLAIALALLASACSSSSGGGAAGNGGAGGTGGVGGAGGEPGEITEETPLLDENGLLAGHGWARAPLMQYDRERVQRERADELREWEYYAVFAPDFAIGLTLADLGILAFSTLTLEDYLTGEVHDVIMFADSSALDFPSTPFENTLFEASNGSVEYRFEGDHRSITVLSEEMEAQIRLEDSESAQAIAVSHAFDEPGQFFYENKRLSMPTTGTVAVGEAIYDFGEAESFGVLDWGRGVWPGEVAWEWGHFTGMVAEQLVGINMGTVNGDDTPGSADSVTVDGVLHKLPESIWEYDLDRIMDPWRFTSQDGRIDLTLTPDFDDSTVLALGPPLTLTRWKVHGVIEGTLELSDGSTLQIAGIRGAAEYVEIVW